MIGDVLSVFLFVAVLIAIYRYHRAVIEALRRFDARNVRRIAEQERERGDPLAHFRATLRTAEEQVEAVSEITVADERLGTPVSRYLFEGERFATRADAERARAEKVRAIAHNYYVDLPRALAERKGHGTVGGTAAEPKPPPQDPPPQGTGSNVVPLRRTPGGDTIH
jgi:hypothetical protein